MNDLGQWLRDAREAQGLSLAEVEAQTRIRQKFLAALEAEEWDSLPNEAVTVGFLRNYAGFLGLDTTAVMDQYRARSARLATPAEQTEMPEPREVDYRPIEFDLSTVRLPEVPWRPVAAVAAIALLLVGLWWVLATQRSRVDSWVAGLAGMPAPGEAAPTVLLPEPTATIRVIRVTATPSPTPEPTVTSAVPAVVEASPVGGTGSETPTPAPADSAATTTPSVVEGQASSILMEMVASQRSWVRVAVDGQTVVETIFEPGQTGEWQGQNQIRLRTGNAAGIDVSINGEPQSSLGGAGEVVDREWNLVDGQVIGTTPAPTSPPTPDSQAPVAEQG